MTNPDEPWLNTRYEGNYNAGQAAFEEMGKAMFRMIVIICGALLIGACSSPGTDAEVSFDRNADFVSDRSYQWVEQPLEEYAPEDYRIRESFLTTVKLHISDILAAKGYVTGETPRFLVNYALGASQNVRVQQGIGGFGTGKYTPFVTTSSETLLVIDVADAMSERSVWRGWAPVTLESGQSDLDAVKRAADEILSRFPP